MEYIGVAGTAMIASGASCFAVSQAIVAKRSMYSLDLTVVFWGYFLNENLVVYTNWLGFSHATVAKVKIGCASRILNIFYKLKLIHPGGPYKPHFFKVWCL